MLRDYLTIGIGIKLGANKKLMRTGEMAEYLNMSLNTLYYFVHTRQIPHIKIGGKLRFDLEEINGWLDNMRIKVV
jgi:excisionase family DNA binding protein